MRGLGLLRSSRSDDLLDGVLDAGAFSQQKPIKAAELERVVRGLLGRGLPRLGFGNYQPLRSTPATTSKCSSRLRTGSRCCRARAAIQASFAGIGRPRRLRATRNPA